MSEGEFAAATLIICCVSRWIFLEYAAIRVRRALKLGAMTDTTAVLEAIANRRTDS